MATVSVSSHINAPLDRVFDLFTDLQDGAARVSGIRGIKVLTPRGFELGTRWIESREVLGRIDDAEMEVTKFENNRGYTITHHKGGVRIDTDFAFEQTPNGTRVTVSFAMNPHGLPPGLLSPLEWAISGKVRDVLEHDLTDLKASLERFAA